MYKILIIFFFLYCSLSADDGTKQVYYPEYDEIIQKNNLEEFTKYPKNKKQFLRAYNFWGHKDIQSKELFPQHINHIKSLSFDTLYSNAKWEELGPFKKPDESLPIISGNGRINVVEFDPNDSTVIWIGSAGGGIWKSEDRGETWKLSQGTDFMSIGISDILISYDNSDVIYAATGDASGVPLFRGYSSGLIKTIDGGQNWFRIGDEYMLSDSIVISDIIQHPEKPQTVYVSATDAVKKTTDGGNSWTTLKSGEWYRSMVMHPTKPDILYVSTFSFYDSTYIYRTTDAGLNWKKIMRNDTVMRTELAVTHAAPDHLYALNARQISAEMSSIIYSNNMGESWHEISPHIDTLNLIYGQGFYNLTLMVDNKDTSKITAGGMLYYRTNDFGDSWIDMQTDSIHVDYHDFKYNESDSCLYIANDGGIYRLKNYNEITSSTKPIYENISEGLGITQIYRLALNHRNDSLFFFGTQDNGTYKYDYGEYLHALGADGMQCFVGNENQNIVYASDQVGNIYKSKDMGNSFNIIYEYKWQERKLWLRQFCINPLNSQTVYAGYENIWRTYNGLKWEKLSNFESNETITAVNVSEADTNLIFTAKRNSLYKSIDNGNSFELIYNNIPSITNIYIDEYNPFEYYFCMAGYVDTLKVMKSVSEDDIINITYNLPNVPINSIVKNQMNGDLIIGTDVGLFTLAENSTQWKYLGSGFPRAIVNEVEILYGKGEIYAATFGRGLWKLDLWSCEITPPEILEKGLMEICEDSTISITYRKSAEINNYFWSDGTKGDTNRINKDGEYYVTAVSPEGCISASDRLKVITYMKPEVQLLLLSGNPVCEGTPVKLKANLVRKDTTGNDKYHYLWSNGDTTESTEIFESGIFNLYVYSDKGCSYLTDDYEVIVHPKPEKPMLIRSGENLITDNGKLIRWYRNGVLIKSGQEEFFEIDTFGVYQAEVFDENMCSSRSETFEVMLNIKNNINVNIYPNPFSEKIIIEGYLDNETMLKYKIYDVTGKIILKNKIDEIQGYIYEVIESSDLAKGFYFIEIYTNEDKIVNKIIKK